MSCALSALLTCASAPASAAKALRATCGMPEMSRTLASGATSRSRGARSAEVSSRRRWSSTMTSGWSCADSSTASSGFRAVPTTSAPSQSSIHAEKRSGNATASSQMSTRNTHEECHTLPRSGARPRNAPRYGARVSAPDAMHPVLAALRERPAGSRIALAVEGGGMRGAVSGGMVLGLRELGLVGAFDAAYGASAGALNAMWLVSGRIEQGVGTWTDPALIRELIRRRRALLRRPVVDVGRLVDVRYEQISPGLFADVLASPITLHPIATDVGTGRAVDLHPEIRDTATLRLALRASAALPVLAGPPVELGGRRLLDAGLSAAIPFRTALADGATHVLVLRSRQEGRPAEAPSPRLARPVRRPLRG